MPSLRAQRSRAMLRDLEEIATVVGSSRFAKEEAAWLAESRKMHAGSGWTQRVSHKCLRASPTVGHLPLECPPHSARYAGCCGTEAAYAEYCRRLGGILIAALGQEKV